MTATSSRGEGTALVDDADAISRVLGADPDQLARILATDAGLRRALRVGSSCREVEVLRTHVAAARVEHRRRLAAAALAAALRTVAS